MLRDSFQSSISWFSLHFDALIRNFALDLKARVRGGCLDSTPMALRGRTAASCPDSKNQQGSGTGSVEGKGSSPACLKGEQ